MAQEQEKILPYEALESLGVNKRDLRSSDINSLLAGEKTDLMKFSVDDTLERKTVLEKEKVAFTNENGKLNFEGKVQLQKYMTAKNTEDNKQILKSANIDFEELQGNKLKFDTSAMRKLAIGVAVLISPITAVALVLVPKRSEIKNDLGLTEKDIIDLKKGEVVGHTNAKGERLLVQLDKDTNNLVSVRSNDISIPNKVVGQEITPIQREQLKNGKEIQIKDSTSQIVFAKIDLNEKTGLSLKDENGIKIDVVEEQRQNVQPKFETDKLYNQELQKDIKTVNDYIKKEGWYVGIERREKEKEAFNILSKYGETAELEKFGDMLNKHSADALIINGVAAKLQEQPYVKNNLSSFENISSPLHAVIGKIELNRLAEAKEWAKDDSLGLKAEIQTDKSLTKQQIASMGKREVEVQKEIKGIEKQENKIEKALKEFDSKEQQQKTPKQGDGFKMKM